MFQWSNDASYSPTQSSTLWIDEKLFILPSGPLVPVSVLLFNNCFLGTVAMKHGRSTGFIADGGIANPAPLPSLPLHPGFACLCVNRRRQRNRCQKQSNGSQDRKSKQQRKTIFPEQMIKKLIKTSDEKRLYPVFQR